MLFLVISTLIGIVASSSTHPNARNFIYIVPDGYGVASQVLARDYQAIRNGHGHALRPNSPQLGADPLVILAIDLIRLSIYSFIKLTGPFLPR